MIQTNTPISHKFSYFSKFSPVLNKLPDHHNLPFFNDMLEKRLTSSSFAFLLMIMQNEDYITQILVFFSLRPVLNKVPDHDNLPLFDDMLQVWYQS